MMGSDVTRTVLEGLDRAMSGQSQEVFAAHRKHHRWQIQQCSRHNNNHNDHVFSEVISISFPLSSCSYLVSYIRDIDRWHTFAEHPLRSFRQASS